VRFIPTGGINLENVRSYLAFNKVLCCAGTWMVKKEWVAAGEFDKIKKIAGEAVAIVKEIRGQ